MDSATVHVDGVTLELARIAGDTRLPTLVLLHEGLGCVAMWKDFPARLAAQGGHPLLAYSRAGYGRSAAVALPRPLEFHRLEARTTLAALLHEQVVGPYVLVGHSDGASIALVHAGESNDPRLAGVAVLAPHTRCEAKCVENIERAFAQWRDGKLRERLRRYHGDNVECAFRGWAETWLTPAFMDWNIEEVLPRIGVPVLAIRGDDDPYNTPVHVGQIAALCGARCDAVGLPGVGHAPHAEAPDEVLALLGRWLESL